MMEQRHAAYRGHIDGGLLTIRAYDEATKQAAIEKTTMTKDHRNGYTIIVTEPQSARTNGIYQPDPSVEQTLLLKDESMQYIYRQQHSQSSFKEMEAEFLCRIEESSIDLNDQSRWIDLRGISPCTSSTAINTKITEERKKIEEEKMRIEKEKLELQKKRVEIEALLKEYYRIREDSTKVDTISMSCSTEKIQRPRRFNQKQIMLLESIGITILKNRNEYKMELRNIQTDFLKRLKDTRKCKKLQQCTQQIVYSSNFVHIGEAFMMIKKEADRVCRQSITKRNIVIKLNKKQSLDKSALCYNEVVRIRPFTDRLCETEASRVQKLTERDSNVTDMDFDRQTVVQRKTIKGNACVAEIDMIIKNQLMRAKQQKILRELSKDDIETVVFTSMLSSGSTTCKASQNLKKCSDIKVTVKTPPDAMKQSRHSTATVSKRIQLRRI